MARSRKDRDADEETADRAVDARAVGGDAADHVSEARTRARQMLGGDIHFGAVDDWRNALVSARDALILLWIVWLADRGAGGAPWPPVIFPILAVAIALLIGISAGRAIVVQLEFYLSVLRRERNEIRENPEQEIAELRVLYAAKGFREPLLTQVVETLAADDDRLLKVMMEEELGLRVHHMAHPLLVGLWHFAAAGGAGILLTLPLLWMSQEAAERWIAIGGGALLLGLAVTAARTRRQSAVRTIVSYFVTALVAGAAVYFLCAWLQGAGQESALDALGMAVLVGNGRGRPFHFGRGRPFHFGRGRPVHTGLPLRQGVVGAGLCARPLDRNGQRRPFHFGRGRPFHTGLPLRQGVAGAGLCARPLDRNGQRRPFHFGRGRPFHFGRGRPFHFGRGRPVHFGQGRPVRCDGAGATP